MRESERIKKSNQSKIDNNQDAQNAENGFKRNSNISTDTKNKR